jgi:hypothetical protein
MTPVCFLLAFFEVLRMRLGASPSSRAPDQRARIADDPRMSGVLFWRGYP